MVKVTERGWAGHFFLADRCLFRRNTLIQGDKDSVVVSTVGALIDKDGTITEIMHRRYYETMVFGVRKYAGYIDADIADERTFHSKWSICADSPENLPDDVDNDANDMHEAVVAEMSEKLSVWT